MRGADAFSGRRILAILLTVCVLLLSTSPAEAKNTRLEPCIAVAATTDTVSQVMWQATKFDCITAQSALQPGDYWVRFQVPESAQPRGEGLLLRTASLWDNGFELWAVHADGTIAHYEPFAHQSISPMRLGATIIVPLKSHDKPVALLLAKVKNSAAVRGVMLETQLSTSESAITFEMTMAVLYAGFAGACLALLVYNIALWRAMRERFLLAYCGMLVATLSYGIFTSGAPHYFVAGMSGANRLSFTIPLLAYTASSALIFMRYFFENANIPRWLVRITFAQAAWMAGFATLYALLAPAEVKLLDLIYVYGFIPVPLIFGSYVWTAWKNRDPFLGYFLVAWSGPAVSIAFRMLHGFDILPYHILIENSTLMGLAFEALVSSLAIGQRVRLITQARDHAQLAEVHAMAMADTDPLTGLLNRRAFLRKLLERQSQWTLVLIDIDHFKRVNDALGHDGGDDVIVRFAKMLCDHAPGRSLVRQMDLPQGYRTTASMGIASRLVNDENDWKILYRAADMALYKAKASGRDCFVRVKPMMQAAA
jgi:GGDEF domain-containing protein